MPRGYRELKRAGGKFLKRAWLGPGQWSSPPGTASRTLACAGATSHGRYRYPQRQSEEYKRRLRTTACSQHPAETAETNAANSNFFVAARRVSWRLVNSSELLSRTEYAAIRRNNKFINALGEPLPMVFGPKGHQGQCCRSRTQRLSRPSHVRGSGRDHLKYQEG